MLQLRAGDIIANSYRIESHIDTGGFADVWKATFLNAGNIVALKIYPKLDADGAKNIELEYTNQADLSHSNLLTARYFGFHEGYPFLEMRYCSGGNAAAKIAEIDEDGLIHCLHDIASALDYLHSEDIVHQDVKPNNFLIDGKGKYYLADLGLSLKLRTTIQRFTTTKAVNNNIAAGTTPPCYRAPEICDRSSIGSQPIKATDVWALGSSIYEMATGMLPFGEFGGFTQIKSTEPPDLPDNFSPELNYIIKRCLSINTWDRPKAGEVAAWMQHKLAKNVYGITIPEGTADEPERNTAPGKKTIPNNRQNDRQDTPPPVKQEPAATIDEPLTRPEKVKKGMDWKKITVLALLCLAIAGFTVYRTWKSKPIADPSANGKVDSSIHAQTTPVTNEPTKPQDGSNTKITTPVKDSTAKVMPKEAGKPSNPGVTVTNPYKVYYYPPADRAPSGSEIEITRIERGKRLTVVFKIKSAASTATYSIYGPDNPTRCFFVSDADGHIYKLLSIYPQGEHLTYGAGSKTITADFERIPDDLDKINIVEGTDRDTEGEMYWTFKGVQLKNN